MTDRAMVDTNILVFAFRKERANDPPELRLWRDASLRLLKSMKRIRVSAIAWLEFLRGIRADDKSATLYRRIQPEVVDGRMVERAIELVNARGLHEKLCRRCHNAFKANPCPACGSMISAKQNMNDALIVAAAELTSDVDTLYCYDTRVWEFAPYLDATKCKLMKPPHPIGPLFDIPAAAAASQTPPAVDPPANAEPPAADPPAKADVNATAEALTFAKTPPG